MEAGGIVRGARTNLALLTFLAAASPTPKISFTMAAQNGSGVAGTGTIVRGTGSFIVTIKLTGMSPNSSHISHLHTGACAKPANRTRFMATRSAGSI